MPLSLSLSLLYSVSFPLGREIITGQSYTYRLKMIDRPEQILCARNGEKADLLAAASAAAEKR